MRPYRNRFTTGLIACAIALAIMAIATTTPTKRHALASLTSSVRA